MPETNHLLTLVLAFFCGWTLGMIPNKPLPKTCAECGVETSGDYCASCAAKLDKQAVSGRCGWCGKPVENCTCDDSQDSENV